MAEISQNIRIVCQNSLIKSDIETEGGTPWREWLVYIVAVDSQQHEEKGKLTKLLDGVTYILHPTFTNPQLEKKREPYLLQEKGWGEFDLRIILHFKDNLAQPQVIIFDLNFREPNYSILHTLTFENPSPELISLIMTPSHSHPTPISNGKKRRSSPSVNASTPKKIKSPANAMFAASTTYPVVKHEDSPIHYSASPSTPSYYANNSLHPSPSYPNSSPLLPLNPSTGLVSATSPHDLPVFHPHEYQGEYDSVHYPPDVSSEGLLRNYSASQNTYESDPRDSRSKRTNARAVVDDVYNEEDVQRINPIHGKDFDVDVRRAWGIPENVNMLELARRLSRLSHRQKDEFLTMVTKHKTNDMTVEETEDEFVVDLYSLGAAMLARVWDYTEQCEGSAQTQVHHNGVREHH